jgi:hypothetical protein
MNWVCDIPGASAATSAMHFALQLGLASFVVVGGVVFLGLALIAYRRSAAPRVNPPVLEPHPDWPRPWR